MKPEIFVQLLLAEGYVHDVSEDIANMIMIDIKHGIEWIEFEDMYGGECVIRSSMLVSTRKQTPEATKNYREFNKDEFQTG